MTTIEKLEPLLADLVAFPTVSSESNLGLIGYAAERLDDLGARVQVSRDESGTKANLFATLGPERDGGIVLSGHSDVVPVEGQDWTTDPFRLAERDGAFFGRGACDMKGFLAACLAMAPEFAGRALARPLHFAFTYDEETGCFGARALMAELKRGGRRPALAIIGEPTGMRIIEGHKGCYEYTTEFTGLAGHGAEPEAGVNAVEYAVRYVARLFELRAALAAGAPAGSRFEPPHTTLHIGRIDGGIARNVIADHCTVDWELRPVQRSDADLVKREIRAYADQVLRPAMRAVHGDADIVLRVIAEVEGLEPVAESEARRIVAELTGVNDCDVVSFGTEAGIFQRADISAVVCGPGSIAQAHTADEFVTRDQLQACLDMLAGLQRKLAQEP